MLLAGCTSAAPPADPPADTPDASQPGTYSTINAVQAKQMMDAASPYALVDVRTAQEYNQEHIDGAMLIPDTEISARAGSDLPDKQMPIIVYCRSGVRAAGAAQALADMGYTQVYTMGGILDWPYDTVTG